MIIIGIIIMCLLMGIIILIINEFSLNSDGLFYIGFGLALIGVIGFALEIIISLFWSFTNCLNGA